jgi:hypothetical protein
VEEKGQLVRQDFSSEAWTGPPANAVGFWEGRVAEKPAPRKVRPDDEVLFECLERLGGSAEPKQLQFRYVVALLLLRGKRLQFEETYTEAGAEYLRLKCPRTGASFEVYNPRLTHEAMAAVQDEVFQVIGWE